MALAMAVIKVGRNVMDHHKGAGASAAVEGFVEVNIIRVTRPTGIYVPQYRNLNRRNYLRGFGLQGGAGRTNWWNAFNTSSHR